MTLKEKVAEVEPGFVGDSFCGDVAGCPYGYHYLNVSKPEHCSGVDPECTECWNREFIPAESDNVEQPKDNVNHPAHYQGKHECIDEMIVLFGVEAVKHFCMCNVYKYRFRAANKNGQEDLDKVNWYMDKLMELERRKYSKMGF